MWWWNNESQTDLFSFNCKTFLLSGIRIKRNTFYITWWIERRFFSSLSIANMSAREEYMKEKYEICWFRVRKKQFDSRLFLFEWELVRLKYLLDKQAIVQIWADHRENEMLVKVSEFPWMRKKNVKLIQQIRVTITIIFETM